MVIRNALHTDLVNDAMFVVKSVSRRVVHVSTVPGDDSSRRTFMLHRIDFQFEYLDFKITRRQFPIRLAFSATVHKGQGKTLSRLIVDLRSNFFSPGQLYVALSRTRKSEDVLLFHKQEDNPEGAEIIHDMPVTVANTILPQAVQYVEGTLEM